MISEIFRKLLEHLSFFYKNNLKLVKKHDEIILKTINKKLNNFHFENKNLKKTHILFNKQVINLIKKEKLASFFEEWLYTKNVFCS